MSIASDITADVAPGEFFDGDGRHLEDLAGDHSPTVIGLGPGRLAYRFVDLSALVVAGAGWLVIEESLPQEA